MVHVLIALQELVQPGRHVPRCIDRRVLGQLQVDQQLGSIRCRKELLGDEAHAVQRGPEQAKRDEDRNPASPHRQHQDAPERAHDRAWLPRMYHLGLLEHPDAEQGRKQGRNNPGRDQRDGDDGENREGVFARGAAREADGNEPRDSDQCAGEPRKGGGGVGEGGGLLLVVAMLQPRDHCLDRDHGVVDEQTEGNDEGAERDPLKADAEHQHCGEHRGEDERDRDGHHGARARAEADQADRENDRDRLPQGLHEVVHRMLDGDGLVGDERRLDPDGQIRRDLGHGLRDVASERQHVAALAHRDGEPDGVMSIDAEYRLCGVGRAARDVRDVAQADHPAVGDEVDGQDVLLGPERARDTDEDLLVPGLHHTRGGDGVLGLQRRDQGGTVDAEARQLLLRELDVDAFVLGPKDVDLRDVRQLQELLADLDRVVPQLPVSEAVRGQAVDDAEGIAELVVEAGADDSRRQRVADVAHLLAHLVPDVRHLRPGASSPSG